jgi:methionyl-tRNA formyltransferase
MTSKHIVFLGAVQASLHGLQAMIDGGLVPSAVLTAGPKARARHSDYADLEPLCLEHGVPCHRINNINSKRTLGLLRELAPDVLIVLGWSQLLREPALCIAKQAGIGFHPTLLPANRGRHPLIWALVHGLEKTGATFFHLDSDVDSGDIIWQGTIEIAIEDHADDLQRKVFAAIRQAMTRIVPQIQSGTLPRIPQDESKASYWRKRGFADGEIDWRQPTMVVYNLIRALARPYPGAHTYFDGQQLTMWRARLLCSESEATASEAPPGTVLTVENGGQQLLVKTGDGALCITSWSGPENLQLSPADKLSAQRQR